jgi:biopolymer transport protein ExbD
MVMIVFYLIVGKLAEAQRSPMFLPPARAGMKLKAPEVLAINILPGEGAGEPRVVVEGTPVAARRLGDLVRERLAAEPETVVQIRASRELTYAGVEPAIEACRAAGVRTVRLATERVP